MIKYFFLTATAFFFSIYLMAQTAPADRKELMDLLQERRERFDAYASSIEKRSGIFGNKTKKDMQQSNNVLTEIVRTDNRIIGVLNRTVDFRNYEKVTLGYDVQANTDRINSLLNSIDTLQKQVTVLNARKSQLSSGLLRMKMVTFFLGIISIVFVVLWFRSRREYLTMQS